MSLTELANATLGDFVLRYVNGSKVQVSDTFTLGSVGDRITFGFTFKPTSSNGTLEMRSSTASQLAAGTSVPAISLTWYGFTLTQIGDKKGYTLADTAMQSDLATHLDIACNTVNGRWWVNKAGTTVVSRQLLLNTPLATLADDNAGDVSYTDIQRAYDTRNVVNVLRVNNHGRDAATGNAADLTTSFTSDSSMRRWGARASDIEMSMYVGGAHAPDLTMRAQEIMGQLSRPRYTVSSVTFNVQSNPGVLELLELRAPIRVRYEDMDLTGRVLSMNHQITPTRWTVTVQIDEVRGGPTFADFSDANGGTFAQFNAAHAGVTFNGFNANPLA
ncbi:hypothetical protein EAH85_03800 [Curtobacterium flaccumfaciens]|nr:hypothetical protein EAH85_03800 [Curtobacterium flaccumfaciens]